MKKRFSEEQMAALLPEAESGQVTVVELARGAGRVGVECPCVAA
ncbi:MAG TPA: hypothetical protein VHQ47_12770 [Phycisphaerae bacterium]|jgi:hypothetical protein|nr:hypothetical protein [Phycisphaerae bacterium]